MKRIKTLGILCLLFFCTLYSNSFASAKEYESKLPVVYINTDDGMAVTSKDEYKSATMRLQGNDTYTSEDELYDGAIEIKGRGTSTWDASKKPYKIKLKKKSDLLGMGESKHWVLLANYYDPSMLKNALAYRLSGKWGLNQMQDEWVDVVLNGSYVGLYQLCEQVRVGKNRVDIFDWKDYAKKVAEMIANSKDTAVSKLEDDMEKDLSWITTEQYDYNGDGDNEDISEYITAAHADGYTKPDITGGYLLEFDWRASEISHFTTDSGFDSMINVDGLEYCNTNE